MPKLSRPDGIELFWQEQGAGPPVIIAAQLLGWPEVFQGLIDDLATDHRVVSYHLRGTGESTRSGPYDQETDIADLEAILEEVSPGAVAVGIADSCTRAVRLAAARPDLIRAVVCPGGNPLGRKATEGTDALAASDSVLEALLGMITTDYRGGLRTIVTAGNPQLSEDEIRDRVNGNVEFCPQDPMVERLTTWIGDSAYETALELGDRLWVMMHPGNPWFPIEMLSRTRELLPDAHMEKHEDGPISRPDLTAGTVRRITAAAPVDAQAQTA